MKSPTMRYLPSIFFLISFEAHAMDVSNHKSLKPVNKEIQNEIQWALHKAAKNNHIQHVQLFIKGGTDVNKQDKGGWTPLHEAAYWGHIEITQQLIKAGANVNKQNNDGETPLQLAAYWNRIEVVQRLLKGEADVNKQNKYGLTPLHYAVKNKNTKLIELICLFIKGGADVNKQDKDGWMPLHYAANKGYAEVTEQLLKGGADVNKQNNCGFTPLHEAAYCSRVEIVQQLLKAGADVNMQDNDGWAPLNEAAYKGHIEVAQQLIKAGAVGLNILHNLVGRNKFDYLTANNRAKLIKLLVYNKPMLVHLKNAEGKTALQCTLGLGKHLTALLQSPEQYIKKHPEQFTFIQDIEYNIQVAECNLLKRTMPNLVHKIRNRELGMPFYAKLRTNQGLSATASSSKQKGKLEAP